MQYLSSRVAKLARNSLSGKLFTTRSSHRISFQSPIVMASLKVSLEQNIRCEDVVKIAEKAAEAILAVYNSKVSKNSSSMEIATPQLPIKLTSFLFHRLCRMRTGMLSARLITHHSLALIKKPTQSSVLAWRQWPHIFPSSLKKTKQLGMKSARYACFYLSVEPFKLIW
jgi:hypothetical protein